MTNFAASFNAGQTMWRFASTAWPETIASLVLRSIWATDGDPALYLTEATALAQEYELDYLEIVAADGSIVSSAQWPARFGYKETALGAAGRPPFLKKEGLAERRC